MHGSHTYPNAEKDYYPQNNVRMASEQNELSYYFLENDRLEDYVSSQNEEQNDEEESNIIKKITKESQNVHAD